MIKNSTDWSRRRLKKGLGEKNLLRLKNDNRGVRHEIVPPSLPQGKLNAVKAAFKAGVTPARIAREFGISLSDVRKAIRSDAASHLVQGRVHEFVAAFRRSFLTAAISLLDLRQRARP